MSNDPRSANSGVAALQGQAVRGSPPVRDMDAKAFQRVGPRECAAERPLTPGSDGLERERFALGKRKPGPWGLALLGATYSRASSAS
jgi:hypothetical protein